MSKLQKGNKKELKLTLQTYRICPPEINSPGVSVGKSGVSVGKNGVNVGKNGVNADRKKRLFSLFFHCRQKLRPHSGGNVHALAIGKKRKAVAGVGEIPAVDDV